MAYKLVQSETIDLGKDGSKWAHGYIPLNAAAIALKHHKTPGGGGGGSSKSRAAVMIKPPMSRTKVHGIKGRLSSSKEASDAKKAEQRASTHELQHVTPSTSRMSIRETTHRGAAGHLISGHDSRGRKVSVFTPHGRADAEQVKANIAGGKDAFAHRNPFQRAVDRGDIKPTGREHIGGGVHGEAAAKLTPGREPAKPSVDDVAHRELGSDLTRAPASRLRTYSQMGSSAAKIELARRSQAKAKAKPPYDPEAWRAANARGNAKAQAKLDAARAQRNGDDLVVPKKAVSDSAGDNSEGADGLTPLGRALQARVAKIAQASATPASLNGKDFRTMTNAEKIEATRQMHGTGSKQHKMAVAKWGKA